jgi:hypothetical protein
LCRFQPFSGAEFSLRRSERFGDATVQSGDWPESDTPERTANPEEQ